MQEKWVDISIPGLTFRCQVSNLGRIKRLAYDSVYTRNGCSYVRHFDERLLKIQSPKYQFVFLNINGKQKLYYVHSLVAEAFIPNPNNLPEVNHKDEDKTNNFVYIDENGNYVPELSNLEWCTHSYNVNYGTRTARARQTLIENGKWKDYSGFSDEEKKEAKKKKQKEWRENNKGYLKEWRKNNKEHVKETCRKYCENNKEKVKAWRRKTYENNREHYLNYQRERYIAKMNHTVYVYDADTGELIGDYKNASVAGKALNISVPLIRRRLKEESLKPIKKKFVVSREEL